jgi:peroxiredoxin
MKKEKTYLILYCFITLLVSSCQNSTQVDNDLAGIQLVRTNGEVLDPASLAGKKVFLNIWATNCRPCIQELPSIERAAETATLSEYIFLAASEEKLDEIKAFADKKGFAFEFIQLKTPAATLGSYALPFTLIFDEQGTLLYKHTGAAEWDSPEMIEKITTL